MAQRPFSSACKRTVDVVAALVLLVMFAPIMLVVSLAILLSMGRPVLFVQQRPGRDGRPFRLLKFRTMLQSKAKGASAVASDAARLTRLGRILRASSLDELPELWNVLRGDMSLVGPRPLLMEYLPLYNARQARRHEVRPGITGLAQVRGRNAIPWEERFELDVWYVEHHNLWLDLKILLATVATVFSRSGISEQGQATMTPFSGSTPHDD